MFKIVTGIIFNITRNYNVEIN